MRHGFRTAAVEDVHREYKGDGLDRRDMRLHEGAMISVRLMHPDDIVDR
jgi:hypothetical protein